MTTMSELRELFIKKAKRARVWDLCHNETPHDMLVSFRGNFCIAMVKMGHDIGLGAAKRSPNDIENDDIGEMIAVSRAIDDLLEQITEHHDLEVAQRETLDAHRDWLPPLTAEEQEERFREDVLDDVPF